MRQDTNSSFNQPSSNIHHVLSGIYFWFFYWDRTAINCMTSSCCLVVIVYSVTLPPYSTCPYTASPQCWTHIVLLLLVICCLLVWHQNKWVKMWKTRAAVLVQGAAACQIRCQNQILTLSVRWGGRCWQIHQIFVKKGKQSQAKKTKKHTSTALQQSGPGLCSGAASAERE